MTPTEFKAWSDDMKAARGRWSLDRVHDGRNGDLLLFLPDTTDQTKGVYVSVRGKTADAGVFEGAIPHIGEAVFRSRWSKEFSSHDEALKTIIERCGANALLAFVLGRSPRVGS